jgi:hypothetical protein
VSWIAGERSHGVPIRATGDYELRDVPAGEVRLELGGFPEPPESTGVTVRVVAGGELEHDFSWDEERLPISGRVTGPDAAPAPGVQVTAHRWGTEGGFERVETETDAQGRYELLVGDGGWTVRAWSDRDLQERPDVRAGTPDVDFALRASGLLVLELVDAESGAPIPRRSNQLPAVRWRESGAGVAGDWLLAGFPGAPGASTIELELPAALVELRVDLVEEGYALRRIGPVQVPADGERRFEVTLERAVTAVLHLSPRDPSEPPLPDGHAFFLLDPADRDGVGLSTPGDHPPRGWRFGGVPVRLSDPRLAERVVPFDLTGRARVRGLGPGEYLLRCVPDDLALEPERITLPADGDAPVAVRWSSR